MSRIDDLIAELCPKGVAYRELGEIAETIAGLTGKTKADFTGGNARYVSYKNVFANLAVDQKSPDYVRVGPHEKQNMLMEGDVVITGSSESLDEVGMSSVVEDRPNEALYLNSFCFCVRFRDSLAMIPGFSKYLFRSELVRSQIRRTANGVTRINISKSRFLKVRIPVPPLAVQCEVVRILDTFTELGLELDAELEARKQQYQEVSWHLLEGSEDISSAEELAVESICNVNRGAVISKGYLANHPGPYPVYSSQTANAGVFGYIDTFAFDDRESITWTTDGANAGSVFYHENKKFNITNVCGRLVVVDDRVSTRYLYHQLRQRAKRFVSEGMGNPKLMANHMKSIVVPMPPLEVQNNIANVLDLFDALVNDPNLGLPAELAARRKQYEYYRDKLLTFDEAPQ